MSTTFVITTFLPEEWAKTEYSYIKPIGTFRLAKQEYQDALVSRWQRVEFRTPVSKNYALEWNLPPSRPDFSGLHGNLSSSGQIISMGTGPKESLLEFVLWHRSFVDPRVPLHFFGAGYDEVLQLTPATTEHDIVEYTGIVD